MDIKKNGRRRFLNFLLASGVLGTITAFLYPVLKYVTPPKHAIATTNQIKLDFKRNDIEADPKKAKYFKFGRDLGIILISAQNELLAFSARCTHLDCTVQNRPDLGLIWCSCHNGRYDLQGKNVAGPPPKPLTQFKVDEVKGDIFISRAT
ncbi:MAG: Rieske 2Fe-2S domain-containing protein [bacterium]|nr:Rieske 2Fe-2S domain-containing protein [bacterium]MBU1918797.1 Rieske 2Fe-2S domain-containing protein [bacterium]